MIKTATNLGLHEFVGEKVLDRYARPGVRAVDLGAGPGAMAERLQRFGCEVRAVDRSTEGYEFTAPHSVLDLDLEDFAATLGPGSFQLVTAIEVIESVESPIGFLHGVRRLLTLDGVAVLTTPNVDSLPARAKFFLSGKIRTMDEFREPTHISPIFLDLFHRQFLPRAGLKLLEHLVFPQKGYQNTRKSLAWIFCLASLVLPGECLVGDNHVFVLGLQ